ncbi:DNA-binding XRE family transcriptional regulator [Methylorubrum rhodinum]|uniref:DNA-binding XRE family transcriptional regulator n=1 Tax=Methylorubrum rhodinum TaxID=29428 RepID=A0A840ZIE0_9HYPH|nr:helix-turn-helix transcriptional regulator [Methylorubrum rhodinum]MBB5756623.1 DNA-binding XRE family transcriptional regulator [Methylorubrum rhodinum]
MDLTHPITPAQIRAGRGLLKWTQGALASRAAVSVVTLNMIESDQVAPRTRTLASIRSVLEGEGIRFIGSESEGFGVMMRPRAGAEESSRGPSPRSESPKKTTSRSMRAAE